ncbi:MAG: hypothetical protein HFG70_05210 [Hungatella sp.]|nr:hypothetical protein [Hungatella sp.]
MRYGQYGKRRSPRNTILMLDWLHIIIGVLVVVMAVIAFIDPEHNMILFPLIFLLAAVLNGVNGIYRYRQSGRDKKKKVLAIGLLLIAVFLLIMTILSGISIWR